MKFRLVARPVESAPHLDIAPLRLALSARRQRVLDFDIENRPLSYLGSDFTTGEVTAMAWAWVDRPDDVTVRLLGEQDLESILREFVDAYDQADLVTGHFILGHDLPMVSGALAELGMPPLADKLVQDTKVHLIKMKGISRSQESLGAMFGLDHPKVVMNQAKWRAANRLTPEGLREVRERVVGDVKQHIELRAELLRLGYLSAPRIWRAGGAGRTPQYAP